MAHGIQEAYDQWALLGQMVRTYGPNTRILRFVPAWVYFWRRLVREWKYWCTRFWGLWFTLHGVRMVWLTNHYLRVSFILSILSSTTADCAIARTPNLRVASTPIINVSIIPLNTLLRNALISEGNSVFVRQCLHQRLADLRRHWSQDTLLMDSPIKNLLHSNSTRNAHQLSHR